MEYRGLTVENWRMNLIGFPVEDAFEIDKESNSAAVADGVTRDCTNGAVVDRSFRGALNSLLYYPRPSPAGIAARFFCNGFNLALRSFKEVDEAAIREAFMQANTAIWRWNNENMPQPDYLVNDRAGCVAAGVHEKNGILSWGYVCDCGLAVFDEKGNLKFRTENEGPDKHGKQIWQDPRLAEIKKNYGGWKNPEARRIIRRDYRNNPKEQHSFGVLTGEPNALYYVRTGTREIEPGQHVVVYTDGLEQTIFSGGFADALQEGPDSLQKLCKRKVRTEGTLVNSVFEH